VINPDKTKEEQFVKKTDLQEFIQQSVMNQQSIEKIEPRRKDMEAFFLEIVAQQ
jgi:ABC-2 type transport system ATP-binding protein